MFLCLFFFFFLRKGKSPEMGGGGGCDYWEKLSKWLLTSIFSNKENHKINCNPREHTASNEK